jgi:hypothetical protein
MSATITNFRDWKPDTNHITFAPAKKNAYGSLNMGLKYNGERLYLRTPKMRCPFGLQKGYDDKGYNVQVCFDNDDADCQLFLQKCKDFDALVREVGKQNASEWKLTKLKGTEVPDAVIDQMFKPMVRFPRFKEGHEKQGEINPEYPPYLTLTILESTPKEGEVYPPGHERAGEKKEPEIITELYDARQQQLVVDEDSLPKSCHLTCLIYATSAYKSTTGYGVVFRAAQIMVFPRQGLEMGKCHISDEDFRNDDDEQPQSFGPAATAAEPVAAAEPAPAPVVAPVAAAPAPVATPAPVAARSVPVVAKKS